MILNVGKASEVQERGNDRLNEEPERSASREISLQEKDKRH